MRTRRCNRKQSLVQSEGEHQATTAVLMVRVAKMTLVLLEPLDREIMMVATRVDVQGKRRVTRNGKASTEHSFFVSVVGPRTRTEKKEIYTYTDSRLKQQAKLKRYVELYTSTVTA